MASFVTAAELAAWLGKDVSEINAVQAALVTDVTSEAIRSYCGWNISQTVTTTVLDGSGTTKLWLPTMLLTAVTSCSELGRELTEGVDFVWSSNGRLLRSGYWPYRANAVTVTYIHGFSFVPGAVKAVALALAGRSFANPQAYKSHSEKQGDYSESWALGSDSASMRPGLTPSELLDLSPFRLPVVE